MRVAEARDADAGHEVNEAIAIHVEEQRALSVVDAYLAEECEALRAGREMLLLLVENLTRFGARDPQGHLDVRHVYRPRFR